MNGGAFIFLTADSARLYGNDIRTIQQETETVKTKFILDAVHLSEVKAELEGTAAAQFAYPATLLSVSQWANLGSDKVRKAAVDYALAMARAEI